MKMEEGNKLTNLSLINNLYKQFIFIHIPIGIYFNCAVYAEGKTNMDIYFFMFHTPSYHLKATS